MDVGYVSRVIEKGISKAIVECNNKKVIEVIFDSRSMQS